MTESRDHSHQAELGEPVSSLGTQAHNGRVTHKRLSMTGRQLCHQGCHPSASGHTKAAPLELSAQLAGSSTEQLLPHYLTSWRGPISL